MAKLELKDFLVLKLAPRFQRASEHMKWNTVELYKSQFSDRRVEIKDNGEITFLMLCLVKGQRNGDDYRQKENLGGHDTCSQQ